MLFPTEDLPRPKAPEVSNAWSIEPPGRIVALAEHKGRLFCATDRQLFELSDGLWRPMVFVGIDA